MALIRFTSSTPLASGNLTSLSTTITSSCSSILSPALALAAWKTLKPSIWRILASSALSLNSSSIINMFELIFVFVWIVDKHQRQVIEQLNVKADAVFDLLKVDVFIGRMRPRRIAGADLYRWER